MNQPKSAESIAVILTVTACSILIGLVLMMGIQVYRHEVVNPVLVEIVEKSLGVIIAGLLLYVGTKLKPNQ